MLRIPKRDVVISTPHGESAAGCRHRNLRQLRQRGIGGGAFQAQDVAEDAARVNEQDAVEAKLIDEGLEPLRERRTPSRVDLHQLTHEGHTPRPGGR